eukprot:jgi/Ulvmu1/23/UM001_0024.1
MHVQQHINHVHVQQHISQPYCCQQPTVQARARHPTPPHTTDITQPLGLGAFLVLDKQPPRTRCTCFMCLRASFPSHCAACVSLDLCVPSCTTLQTRAPHSKYNDALLVPLCISMSVSGLRLSVSGFRFCIWHSNQRSITV